MKYISKEKVLACHNKVDCAGHLVTYLRAATNLNVDYKKLPCSMRLRKVILRMQFGAKDFFHLQREVSYIIVTGRPHFETFNTNYDKQKHIFFTSRWLTLHHAFMTHFGHRTTSPHRLWLPTSEVVSAHLVYQNVLLLPLFRKFVVKLHLETSSFGPFLEDVPSDQMRSSHRQRSISVKLTSKKICLTQKHF